jgi:hypothetical protein
LKRIQLTMSLFEYAANDSHLARLHRQTIWNFHEKDYLNTIFAPGAINAASVCTARGELPHGSCVPAPHRAWLVSDGARRVCVTGERKTPRPV